MSTFKRAHPVRYWLGKRRSPDTIRKIREANKGRTPWNKGKTGYLTQGARKRLSDFNRARRGIRAANWKGGKTRLPKCVDCERRLSRIDAKRCRQCDRVRKHSLRGPLARTWKGGVTPIMLIIRHCQMMREWRKAIFAQDDFTCRICHKRGGGTLHADHYPITFAIIIHKYKIRTLEDAIRCEELWNIRNGRTLCENCHRKRHTVKKVELKQAA